jgi:spore maturation protein CgeB
LAKQKGIVCVGWWGDTPANMKKQGLIVKGWDKLYLKDANATEKLKGLGFDVSLMHEAMNPYWHMPLYTDIAENVIVAGSFYGYRNYLVAEMIRKGVHFNLYGRKLPHWASQSVKDIHLNRFIVKEEKSKLFGGALACLNSTAMSEFNSMNCRAFEIAGAEGLQLLEYRPSVESCFDIDQEIKTFRSIDEAVELVSWAKNYPQEAMQVRRAGRKRALAEHTYEHRLIKIINDIS